MGLALVLVGSDKNNQFRFIILVSPFEVGAKASSLSGSGVHTPIQVVGKKKLDLFEENILESLHDHFF